VGKNSRGRPRAGGHDKRGNQPKKSEAPQKKQGDSPVIGIPRLEKTSIRRYLEVLDHSAGKKWPTVKEGLSSSLVLRMRGKEKLKSFKEWSSRQPVPRVLGSNMSGKEHTGWRESPDDPTLEDGGSLCATEPIPTGIRNEKKHNVIYLELKPCQGAFCRGIRRAFLQPPSRARKTRGENHSVSHRGRNLDGARQGGDKAKTNTTGRKKYGKKPIELKRRQGPHRFVAPCSFSGVTAKHTAGKGEGAKQKTALRKR